MAVSHQQEKHKALANLLEIPREKSELSPYLNLEIVQQESSLKKT